MSESREKARRKVLVLYISSGMFMVSYISLRHRVGSRVADAGSTPGVTLTVTYTNRQAPSLWDGFGDHRRDTGQKFLESRTQAAMPHGPLPGNGTPHRHRHKTTMLLSDCPFLTRSLTSITCARNLCARPGVTIPVVSPTAVCPRPQAFFCNQLAYWRLASLLALLLTGCLWRMSSGNLVTNMVSDTYVRVTRFDTTVY
ncbi:hypothetical protein K488DRAFT_69400 [Vararia minispora EC-137]|uniref:Uncharacterized protein n=1 Tax=Vararia minispora EC-137 TaxID=1314806 RepID=A0ACB8QQV1_9AGAM|nr:hypothetical protein K488DRAFT_69400 [Vararia minispora EC-137]